VTDRFYSIRDRQPFTRRAQSEYNALQPMLDSDLIDITTSPVGFRVPDYALGWRLDLASGEKALAESLTANGVILFTTFKAAASGGTADCTANCANRVYAVRADNGTAAIDLNRDLVVTPADRSSLLMQGGIAGEPCIELGPLVGGARPPGLPRRYRTGTTWVGATRRLMRMDGGMAGVQLLVPDDRGKQSERRAVEPCRKKIDE
jgi:hypothetical protein